MTSGLFVFPLSHALCIFSMFVLGTILWKLFSYVRLRIALLAVNRIPGPSAQSFWSGNLKQFFARDSESFQRHVALGYGPITKLNGFFGEPVLYVSDPKALQTMLIKEEHIFQETDDFLAVNKSVLGTCLVSTLGAHHSKQRKLLNPVFSTKHMRNILPLFYDICHKFREAITVRVREGPRELDALAWLGRVALEIIGQGGLGYSFDPLVTDKPDAYGEAIKSLGPEVDGLRFVSQCLPNWLRGYVFKLFPAGTRVHNLVKTVNTLDKRSKEIYADKKLALAKGDAGMVKQVGGGKDIISILLRANAIADLKDRLPEEEVIAQMSMFIIVALDTTSSALSRILTMLAQHPDYQQKLRRELLDARAADGLAYDDLNQLPLLDSIIRETLRLYPPFTILFRVVNKDTVLPLSKPVYTTDGKMMDAVPIPKGSRLLVGFVGCNMNKAMWGEDALEWKPQRWLSPLPSSVTESRVPGVYSNLMTFSAGKRACIGFKFSEMEMKVILSVLVSNFTFELSDKPVEWNVATVLYPTVGKESNKPQLPLKVGLYRPTS